MEEMGMTNEQYKGMLLDELEDWREVLELAKEAADKKVIVKTEKQIAKINEILKSNGTVAKQMNNLPERQFRFCIRSDGKISCLI